MRILAALLIVATSALAQSRGPVYYDYQQGYKEALKTNSPMVTFVGHIPAFTVPDVVHSTCPKLAGYNSKCIVISAPKDGYLVWKRTLPHTATRTEVYVAIREATVVTALPFRSSTYCPT